MVLVNVVFIENRPEIFDEIELSRVPVAGDFINVIIEWDNFKQEDDDVRVEAVSLGHSSKPTIYINKRGCIGDRNYEVSSVRP